MAGFRAKMTGATAGLRGGLRRFSVWLSALLMLLVMGVAQTQAAGPPFTIFSVLPIQGPTTGGTTVTITGTGFDVSLASMSVTFCGVPGTSVNKVNNTTITVVTPAGAAGACTVVADTAAGTGTAVNAFLYVASTSAPTVTSVSPNSGTTAGGTSVTITGTNFTGATAVTFGGTAATSFTVNSATSITATTPARSAGAVDVAVTTSAGTGTGTGLYTYAASLGVNGTSITVPFGSSGVAINLGALVTGSYTSVAIATGPTRGTVTLSGTTATYVPNRTYTGPDSFTFTATGAGGTSAPATVSISVGTRPDPTTDSNVRGIIENQILTADRFAQTQIDNINRHLEALHCDDNEPGNQCQDERISLGGIPAPGASASGDLPAGARGFAPLEPGQTQSAFDRLMQDRGFVSAFAKPGTAAPKQSALPFSIWTGGALQFGSKTADGTPSNRFTTGGFTIGIDKRLAPGFRAGIALGFGTDRTRIGNDGTRNTATGVSGSLYASYMLMPKTFLDAIVGYGANAFDTQRYTASGSQFVLGSRDGKTYFGSVTLTREERFGSLKVAPYLRLDAMRIMLDRYSETGSDIWALTYNKLETNRIAGLLGLRMSYPIMMDWGVLTPMLRLEYAHRFSTGYNQNVSYADVLGGTLYSINGRTAGRDTISAAFGLKATTSRNFSADLEYQIGGGSNLLTQQIRASLRYGF